MNKDILSMTFIELSDEFSLHGYPKFRAKQVYEWLHKHLASSYDEMSNLPKTLREELNEKFPLINCKIEKKQVNIDGVTVKVENAKYAGTDAGAQDVVLTLPADWLNGDSYTNYEFDTTNVTIPGEITKRRVYINTYADLGGREYVRAGEVNPKFYAEEVVDANSNNTGLIGDDNG